MTKSFIRIGRKGLRPVTACIFAVLYSLAAEEPQAPAVSGQQSSVVATAPPNSARSMQSESVVPAIDFDLPLPEVVKVLLSKFHREFDVILPDSDNPQGGWTGPDPASIPIHLSLRNVTYSEIFEAMDELFIAQKTPFYWQFMMNGSRPTFTLMPRPSPKPIPEEEKIHAVVYVGNSTTPEWTAEKMAELLLDIVRGEDFGPSGDDRGHSKFSVNLHKSAEILVLSGSKKQVEFASETLQAIRQKAAQDARTREPSAAFLKRYHLAPATNSAIKPAAPAK